MQYKTLSFLFSFLATLAMMQAKEYDWPGRGSIIISVEPEWEIRGQSAENVGYVIVARPRSGAQAILQITIMLTPPDNPVDRNGLPAQLEDIMRPLLAQSVESEIKPLSLKVRQGTGWYAQITDANLVGRPPVPDDYKYMRNALLALDDHAILIATMQFDDPTSPEAAEMLAMVCSIRFDHWNPNPVVDTTPNLPPAENPELRLVAFTSGHPAIRVYGRMSRLWLGTRVRQQPYPLYLNPAHA